MSCLLLIEPPFWFCSFSSSIKRKRITGNTAFLQPRSACTVSSDVAPSVVNGMTDCRAHTNYSPITPASECIIIFVQWLSRKQSFVRDVEGQLVSRLPPKSADSVHRKCLALFPNGRS